LVFSYRERAIGTGISVALPIGAGSFDPRSAKVDPAALAHVVRIIAITALTTGEPSGISMGITVLLLLLNSRWIASAFHFLTSSRASCSDSCLPLFATVAVILLLPLHAAERRFHRPTQRPLLQLQ